MNAAAVLSLEGLYFVDACKRGLALFRQVVLHGDVLPSASVVLRSVLAEIEAGGVHSLKPQFIRGLCEAAVRLFIIFIDGFEVGVGEPISFQNLLEPALIHRLILLDAAL